MTKEAYDSCSTSNPIKQFNDGKTKIQIDDSGPHFFISGADGNCAKGEKMVIVVLHESRQQPGGGSDSQAITTPAPTPADDNNVAAGGLRAGLAGLFGLAIGSGLVLVMWVHGYYVEEWETNGVLLLSIFKVFIDYGFDLLVNYRI